MSSTSAKRRPQRVCASGVWCSGCGGGGGSGSRRVRSANRALVGGTAYAEAREARRKQKELQLERRLQKPGQDRVHQLKKYWEKLRRRDQSKEKQSELVGETIELMGDDFAEFIFKHDASRIVQSCLKHGTAAQRIKIAEGLKGHFVELAKSKYGQFIVIKILNYCPKMREAILKEFQGKVRALIRHKQASSVVEELFSQYANAEQRAALVVEFFGREFVLFKNAGQGKTLTEILEKDPQKRESILKHLFETLNNTLTKGTMNHSIVHRALLEYLTHADANGITNITGLVGEQAVEILHTKDGAQAVMLMLAHAGPKERKVMVRSFKPYVLKICKEEFGHMVMLRMFDVVDDTVMVRKLVLSAIVQNLPELAEDRYGHRVLLYLLVGRKPRYFFKQTLDLLAAGDEIRAKTSKKDPALRAGELLEGVSAEMISQVAEHAEMVRGSYGSQLVMEIMLQAKGDKTKAVEALVELAGQEPSAEQEGESEEHVLRHSVASRVYKTLVQLDKDGSIGFAQKLLDTVRGSLLQHATNNGGFVVLALLENPLTQADARKELKAAKKKLTAAAKENPQQKGLQLLVEKLKSA
ncbi:armadillo-type protein [Thamnocephalis sphaerospora]|uniref:Armadillo-type protein n=1 Tax=Thamnocephalis sphaerospora TaxID=78915 RepID=A0A4P9XN60_9FUNG|nr:armadillo-type protein [Thamnocephalis sphaerospora]|eukprot:RKP07356.1 armadillo-type protein [Thamnocephalis sphaerospora]